MLAIALVSSTVMPFACRQAKYSITRASSSPWMTSPAWPCFLRHAFDLGDALYIDAMEHEISYPPSDVFLTLPRPSQPQNWRHLGEQLDTTRRNLMLSRAWGLTKTYNRVHDPDVHEPAIQELRDIHVAIDEAVMRAYGWDDLDLKIGHHPTKIGIRWTVSKEARFELLDRLLEENHRRYALENPS